MGWVAKATYAFKLSDRGLNIWFTRRMQNGCPEVIDFQDMSTSCVLNFLGSFLVSDGDYPNKINIKIEMHTISAFS